MLVRLQRVSTVVILMLGFLGFASIAMAQTKPVPLINQPLVPDAVAPGGPAFTLTVNGTGFVSKSRVYWNGSKKTTTFVSKSQLTATISAQDIATAGTASVAVVNPAPTGGTSNVIFFPVTNSTPSLTFGVASSPATGVHPYAAAVGDFNGDGNLDLAVANAGSNTLSILLGDGAGNFTLASSPATGNHPFSIAVGDFNGDGKLDLAVANLCGNIPNCDGTKDGTLSILLGDGAGNFTLALSPATGLEPYSVAAGDFNGDGMLDLAVANFNSNTVSIFLGDGMGNFTLAFSPATGNGPTFVAVADFNGDDKLDLAVANGGDFTVSILLGDGTGNFALASSPETDVFPTSVIAADFNGDGKLDLFVVNMCGDDDFQCDSGSNAWVLLGDGTGNFSFLTSIVTGYNSYSAAVGDLNGDGYLDLAVTNSGSDSASILLGDGTGNFNSKGYTPTGGQYSVVEGDFNGDGRLDLAFPNWGSPTVSILLQGPLSVTVSPSSLAFGDQIVGTSSAPQAVTLTNSGSATLLISGINITGTDSGDFSQTNNCGSSVAVGAVCTISVTFSPMATGSLSATLTITDNAGGSPQTVPLTGTGTIPLVTLSPTSLTFGNQNVGTTSAPQTVTLTDTGTAPLTILGISVTGDFAQTNNCGTTVAVGAECTISVTFTPTAPGTRTGAVSVMDNAPNSPQMIALTGTGTAPAVTLNPTSLTFGNQSIGTTSAAQAVTLTNSGTETLTITSIAISGNFSQTNTCGTSVAIGASCMISVTFSPTVIHSQTGAVTITDNAFGSAQQKVPLTGTGTEVKLSPASLTFPVQLVGTTSAAMNVTLTNVGSASFNLTGITITGTNTSDFSQTNTCGSSVGAGQSCTISVTFTPTAANTRTASVSVSDNGGGSPQTVPLSGTGTVVELSASSLNFGKVKVGKISPPKIVVLTNIGATTLTITSIKVTGTDNGDFSASNTCHGSVSPGGSCNIVVRFIPTQTGLRTADVSITDDGGGSPQEISLKGTGT